MNIFHPLSWFHWDPPREAFTVPIINHPVFWYGILFVSGFILAYFVINPILARYLEELQQTFPKKLPSVKQTAYMLTDRICWFAVAGTVIGARLGAVFFYDWPYFREHPMEIFKVWHGGLASHGGVLGVMLALYLCTKYTQRSIPQLTFLRLLDAVAVPSALTACFIRLGNFMNQEIVGTPTNLPWGVLFGHPADHVTFVPRHPVQLYEAMVYFITFIVLWCMWKKQSAAEKPGALVGTMFIFIFGSRFILEFWKATQESSFTDASFLQMGQILSIPFVLLGVFLVWRAKRGYHSIKPLA